MWPYYISDTIATTTTGCLNDSKKIKKHNRRSKSMFEWSLSVDSAPTCFSPTVIKIIPTPPSRRHRMGQQQQQQQQQCNPTLAPNDIPSSHILIPHNTSDTNSTLENIIITNTHDGFPCSHADNEKTGLPPISTTTSTTSSIFQRPLKTPLHHYHNNNSDDDDDRQRDKLPIRPWSLKQPPIDDTTMQCIQLFLTQFIKAYVSAGAPSHRLDTCTRLLLRKWNMAAQFGYFPGFMIISFEYPYDTFPTRVQLVKMETDLDIHRLTGIHQVFEAIMMDELTIQQATRQLERVTHAPRLYSNWMTIFAYGVASSTSMPLFFYGGWMDMVFGLGLGMLVAIGSVYGSRRITRFASIFDVVQCSVVGFLAATASARMSSTTTCFYALSVGGVVNLLPGYAALVAMLEMAASGGAAVASGTLRFTTTLVYSLLLGFGLAIGASTHQLLFPRLALISSHASCENTLSSWSHVVLVPLFAMANAIILRAHHRSKFGIILVLAILSHGVHYVALLYFVNYPHLATVLAAFVVALGSNIYARLHPTVGFMDMIIGLFFLIPGSVGVSSTLDTFSYALSNAASEPSPSPSNAAEISIILNAGQQGILFAVHMMVITVSVAMGLVLAALVIYPVRKLLECDCMTPSSSSSSSSILSTSSSSLSSCGVSPPLSDRKIKYRRRDWIGEVTF